MSEQQDYEFISWIKEIKKEAERLKHFCDTVEDYTNKEGIIEDIEMCISNLKAYIQNIKENKIAVEK